MFPLLICFSSIVVLCTMVCQGLVMQNTALRAVAQVDKYASATEMHDRLDIDWLDSQRNYHTCVEVYKLVNDIGHVSLTTKMKANVPFRVLRSSVRIKLSKPLYKMKFCENDFMYRGTRYWESLPSDIQHSKSVDVFKRSLKCHKDLCGHVT